MTEIETIKDMIEGVDCTSCFGDGIERCDNPDHGFIVSLSFGDVGRVGCPCCGHDEKQRMRHWDRANKKYEWNKCPDCKGSGKQ